MGGNTVFLRRPGRTVKAHGRPGDEDRGGRQVNVTTLDYSLDWLAFFEYYAPDVDPCDRSRR